MYGVKTFHPLLLGLLLIGALSGCNRQPHGTETVVLTPTAMPQVGSVSERFLAYNVEMVEVTGGRFWAPYQDGKPATGDDRYDYRPPLDLGNTRLRALARALAPSYVRVSGTWANATYFADSDAPPAEAPAGYDSVLTRAQWRGVVEFSRAVDAPIVTSMATSAGARNENGIWQPHSAGQLLDFTRSLGGTIAATEFANEPNMIELTQPPPGYTPADYRRDYARFHTFMRAESPETLILAPGTVEMGEPMRTLAAVFPGAPESFPADELLAADSPRPDVVSFHYYGASSQRCKVPLLGSEPEDALDPDFLAGIDDGIRRITLLRDRYAPGAPLWNTESGETACGGNPWASTFADTYRFLDQLARSARQGVAVFMHNTLAASDYALLDEHTFEPRPDYWAAWLWRKLMGTTVLDSGIANANIYAHCHRSIPGAVTVLALNLNRDAARRLQVDSGGKIYSMTEAEEGPQGAALNGITLKLGNNDRLPKLTGIDFSAGDINLPPASISFLAFTRAGNPACQ